MNWFDRGLLLVLALGLWALVFNLTSLIAHVEIDHNATFSWNGGFGEGDGSKVYVYFADVSVTCSNN